jgi:phosphoribosylformylglycinamidine synthase II
MKVLDILGRTPNMTELGIFSVMWSEHCSYKTTRAHLKKLPTKAPWVICGPGENAGVIDIGDGQAAIFKMESHNHPSYIEPYQGAATGVGGILRDVFTMGARPVANLNALRFGSPDHPKTRHLVSGVVAGIGGYGNCVGVPTVGGECIFHPSYNGNILVNAMTVGVADTDKIFYSTAAGIGNPVVYVGSKTGRDGIHGATMASTEFTADSEEKRPTVQVGDPFAEKLLIEACLELMSTDAIIAIQDMGAAGLTSSSLEMAGKGECGIELNLEQVPMREEGMTPYELMLSESQERMLMILKPEKQELARGIFEKWGLDFATIGTLTDTGRLVLKFDGEVACDIPVPPLSNEAPVYERPYVIKGAAERGEGNGSWQDYGNELHADRDLIADLRKLMSRPDLASKRWIWQQYDSMVGNNTIAASGADAALVRVREHDGTPTEKALSITADCTPRYVYADPRMGGKQAVAETWRNITATGGEPLAITNCLNFGNPEKPEVMGQIVGALEGMAEACVALNYPIVSGNVSLYNDTEGESVQPTPSIGGVGILRDLKLRAGNAVKEENLVLILIGETTGHLGASLYARELHGREDGQPPAVDLKAEKQHGDFVRGLIQDGRVTTCHDVSDGGVLVAVAEMLLPNSIGARITLPGGDALPPAAAAFGEDQARYVLAVAPQYAEGIEAEAEKAGIPFHLLGKTVGHVLTVDGAGSIDVVTLKNENEAWLPEYMSSK